MVGYSNGTKNLKTASLSLSSLEYQIIIPSGLLIFRLFPTPLRRYSNPLFIRFRESEISSQRVNSLRCTQKTAYINSRNTLKKEIGYEHMCLFDISTSTICVFSFLSHPLFHPFLLVFQKFSIPENIPTARLTGTLEYKIAQFMVNRPYLLKYSRILNKYL